MEIFVLILRLVLAAVFGVAGLAKLHDPAGSKKALSDFGVPDAIARPLVYILPFFEVAVAVSILFVSSSWYAAIGAAGMLTVFTVAMLYQMAKGNAPDCHCFGQIQSEPVGVTSIVRNVILMVLAGFLAVRGRSAQGVSFINSDQDVLIAGFGLVIIFFIATALFLLHRVLDQQTRMMRQIELLELVARDGGAVEREDVTHPHEGLPIGAIVADFALPNLKGDLISLDDVKAGGLPAIFFYVSPTCTPCKALVPDLENWKKHLEGKAKIVLVSSGDADENAEKFGAELASRILLQKDRELADLLKAQWTPTAVLMGPDGRIASHAAAGDTAIRHLVEHIANEDLTKEFVYFTNGHGVSPTTRIGQKVPEFAITDIKGQEITAEYFKHKKTLVAFWSLTCGYCDLMLEDLREWDKSRGVDEPGLLVFSDGDETGNRLLDLASPVVIDSGHKTAAGFGMHGTPSAVMVNENGVIVSETAIGAPDIWSLIGKRK